MWPLHPAAICSLVKRASVHIVFDGGQVVLVYVVFEGMAKKHIQHERQAAAEQEFQISFLKGCQLYGPRNSCVHLTLHRLAIWAG